MTGHLQSFTVYSEESKALKLFVVSKKENAVIVAKVSTHCQFRCVVPHKIRHRLVQLPDNVHWL